MKPVIGYARVSTQRQAEVGGSIATQKLVLRQFAKDTELKIVKIYFDVGSALNEDNGSKAAKPFNFFVSPNQVAR